MLQNVTHSELPVKIESPQCDPMAPKGTDILTPGQCRAARAWLNWSAKQLADRAKVHRMTVQRFEAEESSPIAATVQLIRDALEDAGIEFVGEHGVHFRKPE
jgi:DNA-binding transcriptional regulator YiaG